MKIRSWIRRFKQDELQSFICSLKMKCVWNTYQSNSL